MSVGQVIGILIGGMAAVAMVIFFSKPSDEISLRPFIGAWLFMMVAVILVWVLTR